MCYSLQELSWRSTRWYHISITTELHLQLQASIFSQLTVVFLCVAVGSLEPKKGFEPSCKVGLLLITIC